MSELILLKAYFHKHDAEIAIGLLKEAGIVAFLQADDVGGYRPDLTIGMGNNRVMIHQKDMQKALEVIKPLDDNLSEEELKEIEKIAVNNKLEENSSLKQKTKKDYTIIISCIIAAGFLLSYLFQETSKNKYPIGYFPPNIKCEQINTVEDQYSVCKEYYKSNQLRWMGRYKGNNTEGNFKEFHENGNLRWEGEYIKNKLEGPVRTYYENGQLSSEGPFRNNKLEGEHREYYRTGELKRIINYLNDEFHGNFKTYYKSGNLMEDIEYVKGVRYNKSGKPYEGIEKTFYENGEVWEEWNYKKGKLEGIGKGYYENGTVEFVVNYKNNKLNGEGRFYYENGQVKAIYNYKNNIPTSVTEYNKEGELIFQGVYE